MAPLRARIDKAVRFIRSKTKTRPEIGIILGTGLGPVGDAVEPEVALPYRDIPGFPVSTVKGHKGELLVGTFEGRKVMTMQGRFHVYEGYSAEQVTFPVRLMKALGAKMLVVSNACGGLNPLYRPGDIMLMDDHINLMGVNPLTGPNDEALGPRFPDMSAPYDPEFLALAERLALEEKIKVHRGVYVAVAGPNLETRAEYRFLRIIGADVVGMSTVPEVIVAAHCGLRVLGVSIVTDTCFPEALKPTSHDEILAVAGRAEPLVGRLLQRVIREVAL